MSAVNVYPEEHVLKPAPTESKIPSLNDSMSDMPNEAWMEGTMPKKKYIAKAKQGLMTLSKFAVSSIILVTEIALVAGVGAYVGSYLSAKIIVEDCKRVGIAKVSDTFINCTIVEPKKDPVDKPPR